MDGIRDIAAMIARLEEAGHTRRQIAEGSHVGASAITRIMAGEARNPSFRVINSIRNYYRQHFAQGDPPRRSAAAFCGRMRAARQPVKRLELLTFRSPTQHRRKRPHDAGYSNGRIQHQKMLDNWSLPLTFFE